MRAAILLIPLLVGCPPAEDAPVPDPPADDDDATDPPMQTEGAWSGPSNGVVLYGQLGDYPCEGVGDLDVDADGRATGSISCTYAHTGDVCVFDVDTWVDGGPIPAWLDCFGEGEATYSVWAANERVYGRVQRLAQDLSVEISWTLEAVE